MFDLSDYDKEFVEAGRAVLIDARTVLGGYSNDIVIVGGWPPTAARLFNAPPLFPEEPFRVDIAAVIIRNKHLTAKGYFMS